jgi:uncharacterized protein YegJ (DUF2314 family)
MPDGLSKGFIVIPERAPPIAVIDSTRTYCKPQEVEERAGMFEDERARDAYRTHTAWISVDALGLKKIPGPEIRAKIYDNILGKVAAEFLDDDSLLLLLPREGRVGLNTPQAGPQLAGGNVKDAFGDDPLQEPIIHVGDNDAAINAAMAKARARLPQFVEAFNRLGQGSNALVKGKFTAPGGQVEFMWVRVTGASRDTIAGEVVNRPAATGLPRQGTLVEIAAADVGDWAYVDEKENPHGMFVEKILRGG